MFAKLPIALLAFAAFTVPAPLTAGVPVHLTGNSAADDTLQKDILQTITHYGAAFNCPAPSNVRANMLNSSMVPPSLRKPSLRASYEEWDAIFCGKTYRFFVTFWPDPQGGSFLSVTHPYPPGAPTSVFP